MTFDRERYKILMMGYLDGELAPDEQKEFERMLADNPELQKEFNEYSQLKEVTQQMKFKQAPDDLWDSYWQRVYNRIERGIGWILVSIGAMICLAYFGYMFIEQLINDPYLSGIAKFGIFAIVAGMAVLLVSVIREKLFSSQSDPYKEIKR